MQVWFIFLGTLYKNNSAMIYNFQNVRLTSERVNMYV